MATSIEEQIAPFLSFQACVVQTVSTLSVLCLVYGIYMVIFGLAIRVLYRCDTPSSKLYLGFTLVLFALTTFANVMAIWKNIAVSRHTFDVVKTKEYQRLVDYLAHDQALNVIFICENLTFTLTNAITDVMLIHRCYIIWSRHKLILYPLLLCSLSIACIGTASVILGGIGVRDVDVPSNQRLYDLDNAISSPWIITVAVFNLILTFMTGGRIWWISREAQKFMKKDLRMDYNTLVALILESELLYSLTLIAVVVFQLFLLPSGHGFAPIDIGAAFEAVGGLAPTLIIVRSAYGKTVESVNQVVSTLQFADGPTSATRSAGEASRVRATTVDMGRPRGGLNGMPEPPLDNEANTV
ncbi:hypothetical protein PM082_023497 [Marasmius tenuissimus]|nr:hypothetical protein PM082_023497 [Marasmius tenuissimus]